MAIKNLGAFNAWQKRATQELLPEQVVLFQKRITLELFRRLVLKSPVGNPSLWANPNLAPPGYVGGRFRANWQVTVNLPAKDEINSTSIPSFGLPQIPAFAVVYLTNNVPYAERLEMGWSSQAPAGVVSVSIAELTGVAA